MLFITDVNDEPLLSVQVASLRTIGLLFSKDSFHILEFDQWTLTRTYAYIINLAKGGGQNRMAPSRARNPSFSTTKKGLKFDWSSNLPAV